MSEPSSSPWRYILADTTIGEAEVARVTDVLRSGWLTQGPVCEEFERRFADLIGAPAAQAKILSSCTAALHLGLIALDIGPGDEVIVPSLTFVATANCVRYVGATPVFADIVGADDLTIDPEDVRRKITPRTRAVICVHYAGYPAALEQLGAICSEHGLHLVEDVAHAPGATLKDRGLGTWGDIGCFSFFSNKNLAMGEGGLLVARDEQVADRVSRLRSHGMTSVTLDRHKGHAFSYDVVDAGYNFRSNEVAAAIGLAQLERLPAANEQRRMLTARYRARLDATDGLHLPFIGHQGAPVHHIFPVVLAADINREAVMQRLKERGIQTSVHYPPIHLFTDFRRQYGCGEGQLPVTENIAMREVTLPLHPKLEIADVDIIAAEVTAVLAELRS